MKKKILGGVAVLVFAVAIAVNVNFSNQNELSPVSLKNVEALADEGGRDLGECYMNISESPGGVLFRKCLDGTTSTHAKDCGSAVEANGGSNKRICLK